MTSLLATPELDHAGRDAIAAALDRLRTERTADETYVRTRGREMCVRAVRAAPEDWHRYSTAAARRAAVNGRWLLPVCGVGAHGEWLWIAYDIGSATPLSDYRKGLVLPTATCLRLLSDVARGLDDAIAKRVFPCELPLESVFVSRHGVRLGDLGTAREALGRAGPGGDTPHVPPEVLRGEPATARSGVYVFGALAYHLLTGASPKGVHGVPLTGWRPDLPAAMNQIVATAMSGDPERRPRSAGHVNELVQRTMRDAAAAPRARLRPPATVPQIRSLPGKPPPRPRTGEPAAAPPARAPAPGRPNSPSLKAKAATLSQAAWRSAAGRLPLRRFSALVVAGSVLLGVALGLLLGPSPDADPARAEVVRSDGMEVTVPPGWRATEANGPGILSVRQDAAAGSSLQVRLAHSSLVPPPASQPVRLGRLQAWRAASPGIVRYAAPASAGTVSITCRASPDADAHAFQQCERIASTLTFDGVRTLPLAGTLDNGEDRLRAIVANLRAERDIGRRRLANAVESNGQRAIAQNLARSHESTADALARVPGAEPIEAAVRRTAAAYSSLAASAESRSPRRWERARERLHRLDEGLDEALAARG